MTARAAHPVALIALLSFLAPGARAVADPGAAARALYDFAGIEARYAALRSQILAQLGPEGRSVPEHARESAERAARRHFAVDALRAETLQRVEGLLAAEAGEREAALAWLRSPAGQRVAALEAAATHPEAAAAIAALARDLATRPPAPPRVALLKRLDAASESTERALDTSLAAGLAVALATDSARPASQRAGLKGLRPMVESQREHMREFLARRNLVSLLYTYRELSDAELTAYVEFLESAPGGWYQRNTARAFLGTLESAIAGFAKALDEGGGAAAGGAS